MGASRAFNGALARTGTIHAFYFVSSAASLEKHQVFPYPDSLTKFHVPILGGVNVGHSKIW